MIFNYRTLMLIILLPLVSYANDNTAQLKKLMQQYEHNQEWLKKYAKALAALDNLSSAEISYYVNYVVTDKQFQFKSEEGFNIIMAAIYAYHSSGEDGAALILMNTFIKHLGSEAYTEKYAELWFKMASIYELKGNIDSLNYEVEKTKHCLPTAQFV